MVGATGFYSQGVMETEVSIRAPVVGATTRQDCEERVDKVSIRAPVVGATGTV